MALADRVGASKLGRPVGRMAGRLPAPPSGWEWHGPQSGQGAIELGFSGSALGQMQGGRRAERVSRTAIEKNRRRRVLSVASCSPRPMRAVQRARLWVFNWTAGQAALAAKRQGCGIGVPWASWRIPARADSHNEPCAKHTWYQYDTED